MLLEEGSRVFLYIDALGSVIDVNSAVRVWRFVFIYCSIEVFLS